MTPSEVVEEAIKAAGIKLASGEMKLTVAEYERLLDLKEKLAAGEARRIVVTWVNTNSKPEPFSEE